MTFWNGDISNGGCDLNLFFWETFTDLICFRLVEGVLFSIIGIVGFLGNTLSILVLISPQVGTYIELCISSYVKVLILVVEISI